MRDKIERVKVNSNAMGWRSHWDTSLLLVALDRSFSRIKWLGVLVLPPGWDANPLQAGLPPAYCQAASMACLWSFLFPGGERHCESKVSCPRTQHCYPGQGPNLDSSALTVIFYRSYVDRQHFRLRSFTSLCSTVQYFGGRRSSQIRYAAHF